MKYDFKENFRDLYVMNLARAIHEEQEDIAIACMSAGCPLTSLSIVLNDNGDRGVKIGSHVEWVYDGRGVLL